MNAAPDIMHPEFMGFVTDEASSVAVRAWASRQGWPEATVQFGGPDLLADMLEQAAPPKLVLIDIDGHNDPFGVCSRLIDLCGPATRLIAVGSANDIGFYRRMLALGVVDYLVKPLALEHLVQAAVSGPSKVAAPSATDASHEKLVYVLGVRGGVGASTLAVNAAWLFAQERHVNTALIDLDLHFGTAALALDIEAGRGMRDILSSPSRVDSLMIASSMITAGEKLTVLSAEESVDEAVGVDSAALAAVIQDIRGNFDVVVIDLPRHHLPVHRKLLGDASAILLVTEQSLSGIRDTLRIKTSLKALNVTAPVLVIASRVGKDRPAQIDAATFEKGVQGKIDFVIPEDVKPVYQAANTGKAAVAVAPQAEYTKAVRKIIAGVAGGGKQGDNGKTGLLSGLFKGKSP